MDTGTLSVTQPPSQDAEEDRTREVLNLIHRLLLAPEKAPEDLPALLTELVGAFGAEAAGLALGSDPAAFRTQVNAEGRRLPNGPLPWEQRPELLEKAGRSATALTTSEHDQASFLWTAVEVGQDCPCVLWVGGAAGRSWSHGETSALPLAGQALVRLVGTGTGAAPLAGMLERARLQSNLEKTALFTGRLAHDFGNVLTGILGFCELSLSQLPADSLPRRYVDEVWQSAQKGARWVQKLQWFSRRRPQQFVPASIPAVVAQEEVRLRAAWQGTVTLHVNLPADLPGIGLDAESLSQIFVQLLDNAREAIPGQGTVTVTARNTELKEEDCRQLLGNAQPGPHVEITIADTGHGFSAEARRRLFAEPFYSSKPRHRGLGLAVVYGILQTYRGGLRFGPEAAPGAVVRVFVPAVASEAVVAPVDRPPAAAGARVLVVDDDQMTARFITSVLQSAGYKVKLTRSVAQAVDAYARESGQFDLVLTDVNMPQENGFDLARQLRRQNPAVTVLFMSGRLAGEDCPQSDFLRDYDLVLKPFRPDGLLSAVRGALERKPQGSQDPRQK
jgi:signal transduction histidine kinase